MLAAQDWLAQQATSRPGAIALIEAGRTWNYAQLNEATAALCGRLAQHGVAPGHRVAALLPNCAEYVLLIHALARLGAVLVPLNVRLTSQELRWQLGQAHCDWLLCNKDTESQAAALQGNWHVLAFEQLNSPIENPFSWRECALDLSLVQGIVYTSGTTGRPKGAMLTHANHLWSALGSAFRLGVLPHDRWLLCLPLYHVGGLSIVLRSCLYGTAVVLEPRFDPDAVDEALRHQRVTLFSLVSTMLHRLLDLWEQRGVPPTLRCALLGGSGAPQALLERARALGVPLAATYGLTEAASQVATMPPHGFRKKIGSAGKPLLWTSLEIVDDQGNPLPAGEIGEIVVDGPTVMSGYDGQPEATACALRNGKLFTGDVGYLDDDHDLWVVNRRTDLIVTGGENVYPAEVEAILLEHPLVAQVCVVGVPDEEWGQRVAAVVVPKTGAPLSAKALDAFCEGKLAGYKRPRSFHFVEALPTTNSDKVDRRTLIERFPS